MGLVWDDNNLPHHRQNPTQLAGGLILFISGETGDMVSSSSVLTMQPPFKAWCSQCWLALCAGTAKYWLEQLVDTSALVDGNINW